MYVKGRSHERLPFRMRRATRLCAHENSPSTGLIHALWGRVYGFNIYCIYECRSLKAIFINMM